MTEHRIEVASFPPFRNGKPASLTCLCGVTMTEEPDMGHFQDPHEPLIRAFREHRVAMGSASSRNVSIGHDRDGSVWVRRKK